MAHTPHITCRTTTHHCNQQSKTYALMICGQEHISEIALCDQHTNYNNVYQPACPNCRNRIEDTILIIIGDITNTHLTEYIFHTRHTPTGSTIINHED